MGSFNLHERLLSLLCAIPALVAGLTFHEFAHAWAADKLGDPTPRQLGRLTLDPMVHLDLIGAVFFVVMWFSGYGIGWAKPVQINPRNFRNPRRDGMLVAVAGPISNLLQTPIWIAALFLTGFIDAKLHVNPIAQSGVGSLVVETLMNGVMMNLGLAAFNMIPFPPLDGHWVLQALGGPPVEELFNAIRPYSFIALIMLLDFTPIAQYTFGPVEQWAIQQSSQALVSGWFLGLR